LALKGVKCNALCGKRSFRGSSVSEAGIIKLVDEDTLSSIKKYFSSSFQQLLFLESG